MSDLYLLTDEQMARRAQYSRKATGILAWMTAAR